MALPNPNKSFPPERLDAAARLIDPTIDWPEHDTHVRDYRLRAARCHVQCIVAALCGIDVLHDLAGVNAQRLDAVAIGLREGAVADFVLLPRKEMLELRDAVLNDTVAAAVESVVGSEKAAELLGRMSLL